MRIALAALIFIAIVVISVYWMIYVPYKDVATPVPFVVSSGQGVREIAYQLHTAHLVRSPAAFTTYAVIGGTARQLKTGTYQLSADMNLPRIIALLVAGGNNEVEVVIPEGYTLKDIDAKLSAAGVIGHGALAALAPKDFPEYDFLKNALSLEGYLFPDTYRFYPTSDAKDVARKLLDRFSLQVMPVLRGLSDLTVREYVIVASLIEREVREQSDRELVSGIIRTRLARDMRLQIDATISYIKCSGAMVQCPDRNREVAREDLVIDSPLNTYRNAGLPPAAIANAGFSAFLAAAHPKTSNFLYYLSDPATGTVVFSATLDEHNENRVKYLLNR